MLSAAWIQDTGSVGCPGTELWWQCGRSSPLSDCLSLSLTFGSEQLCSAQGLALHGSGCFGS